jgi:transcriptional regulator with XRE-family HTH domain
MDASDDEVARAVAQAVGEELRRARVAKGWSRAQFVPRLPSGIGDRTLLAYEHGLRHLTLIRLLELCEALDVVATDVMSQALQRARLHLENLVLTIDLRALVNSGNFKFRPLVQWAKNKLNKHPDGVVELAPVGVIELADFMGCSHHELATYLARFVPERTEEIDPNESHGALR